MNKLETWNAYVVFKRKKKQRDPLAQLSFLSFFSPARRSFFFLSVLRPLTSDRTLNNKACLWTDKTGVRFHTLPGGCHCCERACESGKGVGGAAVGGVYVCMV